MAHPRIEFVNHASVLISHGDIALLSDPWYWGPAFHKGWSLLVETPHPQIGALLQRVSHLWLSHEHPDHFSVPFFKRYGATLRERGIPVLFQKIDDRRVVDFLTGEGIAVREIPFRQAVPLADDFAVTCIKDEFYDSALSVRAGGVHILNLNDCNVATEARAREIRDITGPCDILLSQFSYAAWKGGPENIAWRQEAARQKLANMAVQIAAFAPRVTIPFASFVAFSNERNAYLNDAANTPRRVAEHFADSATDIVVMRPGDVFDGVADPARTAGAVDFWEGVYDRVPEMPLQRFESVPPDRLHSAFETCIARIFANNSRPALKFFQRFSPVRVFQPVVIRLDDLGKTYVVDYPRALFTETDATPDLAMHSESLWFLFSNTFGFDTLGVNGCLEEVAPGGFAKAAKSLAIENLNNLGIRFGFGIVFHGKIIRVFFERLIAVSRRMRRAGN